MLTGESVQAEYVIQFSKKNDSAARELVLSGANSPITRLSAKVLKEAYEAVGYKLTFKLLPPARALMMSSQGKTGGEIARIATLSEQNPTLKIVKIPVGRIQAIACSHAVKVDIKRWQDLAPFQIGIKRSNKFAIDETQGMRVQLVSTNKQLFEKLLSRRNDVIVVPRIVAQPYLKKYKSAQIKMHETALATFPLHHYLHQKHSALIPTITAQLAKMKKSGRIEKILSGTATSAK